MQSGIIALCINVPQNGETVPDLKFRVESAAGVARAAVPMMSFRVRVTNHGVEPVSVAALRCRIDIEAPRRDYTAQDRERLKELFGESSQWAETLQTLLWTSTTLIVPAFSDQVACELLAPCSFDFNVAATKYFYGLQEGTAPLRFEFSGQVVFQNQSGQLESVSLEQEQARYELPVTAWSEMMDNFYPASVWLRLPRETFERLHQYKIDAGIPTWEDVFERILPAVQEVVN
jgi:Family of unknown function (DUF6084)